MRKLAWCVVALAVGCGPVSVVTEPEKAPAVEKAVEAKPGALPADLRTRKAGVDWPAFLGPNGDSTSPEKGIISPWPKAGPRIVWEKKVGIGYSVPSISRGRLFLFDRQGNRCRLRCWKAETGEELWAYDYPTDYRDQFGYNGGPRCCPVVDGDRVYAFGPDGMLLCVKVADGKLVWKVDTAANFGVVQNFFGVGSTPVVEGNSLIVQVGGSPKGSDTVPFDQLKGNGSGVVAFDKYTGKVKWKVSDELASYSSPVLTTIGGRRWCLVFARGGLLGIDPGKGKVEFHFPWRCPDLESVNASNPVVVGDRVLITECYGPGAALLEVKGTKCKEVWTDADKAPRARSLACHWMTPVHVGGYVYGSSGRHTTGAELRCVELATGKVTWSKRGLTRSSLLLVDNHFVCLGEDGTVRLLRVNPKRYEQVSEVELKPVGRDGKQLEDEPPLLEYPCWAAPVLSHGLLYLRGKDRLVCLELIPARKKD
jgi:outer membrane protein assembly factor BamB